MNQNDTSLIQRDKSTISRHIKNVFDERELDKNRVVANFATTAADGKTYQVDHYNSARGPRALRQGNMSGATEYLALNFPMTVFVCADTFYETFFLQSRKNSFRLSLTDVQLLGCRFC